MSQAGRPDNRGTEPIRVAVVIGGLGGRGAEKQTALLARHIDRRSFDLRVVTFTHGGVWAKYLQAHGVPPHVIRRFGHYDLSRHARLYWWFRSFRPHIVVSEMTESHAYATPAAVAAGVHAIVATYRTDDFYWNRAMTWAEHRLLPYVDVQLANTQAISRALAERLTTNRARHWVIYNAVDLEPSGPDGRSAARALLQLPDDAFVAGFIGAFSSEKRQETALLALARLASTSPRILLVFMGTGRLEDRTRRRAQELGVLDRCRFLGFRSDVGRLLPAFDVTLNCSLREGGSNSVAESLAASVPVLATAVGGNVEFVQTGTRGELFSPDDSARLAELLRSACEGRIDLAGYAREARAFAQRAFDLPTQIRETERLFRMLRRLPRRRPGQRRGPLASQESRSGPRVLFWADPDVRSLPPELEHLLVMPTPPAAEVHLAWRSGGRELPSSPWVTIHRSDQRDPPHRLRLIRRLEPDVVYLLPSSRSAAGSLDARLYPGGPRVRRFEDSPLARGTAGFDEEQGTW